MLTDTLPFWLQHAPDRELGGYLTALNRDGSVVDTDKGLWQQGRFAWLLSRLCNRAQALGADSERHEWQQIAELGIRFIREFGFDDDQRMWFQVTQDGRPLRKRRYAFSECFAVIALAEFGRATDDDAVQTEAIELFERYLKWQSEPNRFSPKFTDVRPLKSIGRPMIEINVCQILRETLAYEDANRLIDAQIDEIKNDFVRSEEQVVLETVSTDGTISDHFDGRTLNPGHAIEAAWFIMYEGQQRERADYVQLGCQMLDWMWQRGWDAEYGGLFYFRDLHDLPVQEYWHDMKFWWPHNETIIATLMAALLTGDAKYENWHRQVHEWSYNHFPDPEYGEWYGYLHRDGRVSVPLKGNLWKGPFHLPRMQLTCWQQLDQFLNA